MNLFFFADFEPYLQYVLRTRIGARATVTKRRQSDGSVLVVSLLLVATNDGKTFKPGGTLISI
jgi:hypothetical protein